MAEHRLIKFGTGSGVWGRCSCDLWAWLGTYAGPKGRLSKLREEHAGHVRIMREQGEDGR